MHFIDSVCTFIFSILVIISTLSVLRDAILVLMEGISYMRCEKCQKQWCCHKLKPQFDIEQALFIETI